MLKNETARNGLKHDSLQNEVRYFQAGDYVIDDSTSGPLSETNKIIIVLARPPICKFLAKKYN